MAAIEEPTASATSYASRSISWDDTPLTNPTVQGGAIYPDAAIEERHDDESVICENPVEDGSVSNDHAYDLPQQLELTYAFSPASRHANGQSGYLDTIYQKLLTLKQAKILVNVITGKRSYQDLLIKGLSTITDSNSENVLVMRISLQQLLLTYTETTTTAPASQQSNPERYGPTQNGGTVSLTPATNFNSGSPAGS